VKRVHRGTDRREFLKGSVVTVFAGLTAAGLSPGSGQGRATASRPNILLIFSDDQGMGDLSCYGHSDIPTPNLDRLASDGVRMSQFYAAAPVCTPSRFGLLTGMAPNRSRDSLIGPLMFAQDSDKSRGIREHEVTLASMLKSVGYSTGLIGKWHLGHGDPRFFPLRHGFDSFIGLTGGCIDYWKYAYGNIPDWYRNEDRVDCRGYATDVLADEAVAWLQEHRTGPFFLYLSFNSPHYGKGWDAEKQEFRNVLQAPPELMAKFSGIKNEKRRTYAAMVTSLDMAIGRVLQSLDENGLAENTFVIFISDNGADPNYGGSNRPFRGAKATHLEGGIRVPCLMRFPGRLPAGCVSYQVGSCLDIVPTLASLTGFRLAQQPLDGHDLGPALFTGRTFERDLFFFAPARGGAYRSGRWKMVSLPSTGGQPGETGLYDLETDALESNNLAAQYPEKVSWLKDLHLIFEKKIARGD
jgi:arylsulfatase A